MTSLSKGHVSLMYTMLQTFPFDARSEGASVHEKRPKKSLIFRPIDVFNFGFFKSDDLIILTIYGILARKDSQFFLFFMVQPKRKQMTVELR